MTIPWSVLAEETRRLAEAKRVEAQALPMRSNARKKALLRARLLEAEADKFLAKSLTPNTDHQGGIRPRGG